LENPSSLVSFCILVSGILSAGCVANVSHEQAANLTVSLECSRPCALDLAIEEGHLKVEMEELARKNCSVHAGGERITIICPTDGVPWQADQHHPYEYLAKHGVSS